MLVNISDMFHDDSFESYNFALADRDDCLYVDADHSIIQTYKNEILARMSQGESYLSVNVLIEDFQASHSDIKGFRVLEIQWG